MATILELAEFSNLVYGGSSAITAAAALGGVAANATEATATGAQWTLLQTFSNSNTGYYGAAYINNSTGEIVIANRGTRPTSLADLLNDVELASGIKTPAQDDAASFAVQVANAHPGIPIIETGHSLGGNEAQAATVALTKNGTSVSAVIFNSPGIGGYPVPIGVSYKVQNFYDQGDAIHLAGSAAGLKNLSVLLGVEAVAVCDNGAHDTRCAVLFLREKREAANDFEGRLRA
jgi:hypothetical protein